MSWKEVVQSVLAAFGVVALIFLCGFLESAPLAQAAAVAAILGIILWVVYVWLVLRDNKKKVTILWIMKDGKWHPIMPDGTVGKARK
jgi:amino acid transporter